MTRITPFLAATILLGGCATRYATGPLPADHPANPKAATAPASAPSITLAINERVGSRSTSGLKEMQQGSGALQHSSDYTNQVAPVERSTADTLQHGDHAGHNETAASTRNEQKAATQPVADDVLYACPMHPEVTSTNPNDRCPECEMKIKKPVKKTSAASTARSAPADGRGHASHGNEHGGH